MRGICGVRRRGWGKVKRDGVGWGGDCGMIETAELGGVEVEIDGMIETAERGEGGGS